MRFRLTHVGVSLPALALAAALLGGCGSSSSSNELASKTPVQIIDAAKAAAASAVSAHVAGSIVSDGKPISLDMELVAGKGGKGRITVEGLSVKLIQVDKAVYINGSTAFYKRLAGTAAAQLLQGKWLKAPANSANFESFSQLTNLRKLVGSTLAAHGKLTRGESTTVAGQKVVGLTDGTKDGTLYVATTGAPYPIALVKKGASGGRIVFDRWNKPVTIVPPADSVNINQLQSGR
ncbi:MAG TPA: hypothetical protein VFY36_00885 [Solirubrobacteraceae bacterium]|nr:hypothetical protein [Solirubrobacteraceae bacterium]